MALLPAWRRALVHGEMMGISGHFLLIGLCACIFIPASFWGFDGTSSIAPVSVSLFIGAFMFGIGMQLANGCGSGVLFSFGGGSGRMIIALPFLSSARSLALLFCQQYLIGVLPGQLPLRVIFQTRQEYCLIWP